MLGHYCCSPGGCFAAVWFIGGCFAAAWFVGGCFAAVSSASSLAAPLLPRVTWPFYRDGCFAVVCIFASPPADAWPPVGLLVDALSLFGSLVDALPSLLLDDLLC
jgi:hypothetical protein